MSQSNAADSFTFLPQGAIIQDFRIGGRNIVLGFPSAESYQTVPNPYFGQTIGRVANRISGAEIQNLNQRSYALAANNGPNCLHGGVRGWGHEQFDGPTPCTRHGRDAVAFKYLSKDGEEGFPGTVELRVWFYPESVPDADVHKTSLEVEYEVELVGDEVEETVVAPTNHSYFNIGPGPTIEGTKATLYTNTHQVVDEYSIPTGEIAAFPGIPQGEEFVLRPQDPDPDHCFIMDADAAGVPLDTRVRPMEKLCEFYHPDTRIHLEVLSTEPAFQFYTGRFINVPAADGQPARGRRAGMCVEASRYVDAVNREAWRGMVVLRKGQLWGSRTIYRAWKS